MNHKFFVYRKREVWDEMIYLIPLDSYEEAEAVITQKFKREDDINDFSEEYLWRGSEDIGFGEFMDPKDQLGEATRELRDSEGKIIATNEILQ